jgi:hypothetical protein
MEEEEAMEECVPEESRGQKSTFSFDLVERKGMMACLKINKKTGEPVRISLGDLNRARCLGDVIPSPFLKSACL